MCEEETMERYVRCECGHKIDRTRRSGGLFRHARLNHRGDWPTDPRVGGIVLCKCGQMYDGIVLPKLVKHLFLVL